MPACAPASPWDAAQAAAQIIAGAALPKLDTERSLALAWALKDACYAAWMSAPGHAVAAAQALAALALAAPHEVQVQALARWTQGIADITRGAMSEAAHAFDDAAAAFTAARLPHQAALTQVPKIMALSMLGQHDAAAACAQATLVALRAHGDTAAAAKVSLNLGSMQMQRDAYAVAATHYRQAAVLFARDGQMKHSVMADIAVADATTALGDFDEAERMYHRGRTRAAHHALPVVVVIANESLALLQLARGCYALALAGLEQARREYAAMAMPQHLAVAEKQLADVYLELHLLPEALALYDAALPRFEALEMVPEQGWTLAQQGRALALLARPDAAAAALQRAAELFAAQDNTVGAGAVALVHAEMAAATAQHGQALAWAQTAAGHFLQAAQPEGQLRAELAVAQAQLALGQQPAAAVAFAACLARARALGVLPQQVRALTGQGLLARQQGRPAAAHAAFEAAISLFEDQRRILVGDDLRQAWLGENLRPYREVLAMTLADERTGAASPQAVLEQLERVRARSMGERLTLGVDQEAETMAGADPAIERLRGRLNWLSRRLRKVQDDAGPTQALVGELRHTEHSLLEHLRRQRLGSPGPGAVPTVPEQGLVSSLCTALGSHQALVEYGVDGDELFACVVRHDGVRLERRLAGWPAVREALRSALFQIDTLRHGSAPVARHLPHLERRILQRMRELHGLLWAPLASHLAGCNQVLWVPHAQLAGLPLAALHDGHAWLGTQLELAMVPSARVALHGLHHPPGVPQSALVMGESTRLPQARAEARHVAGLFRRSVCLVDADATLAALRSQAGAADVIHLACHAQFRSDNPMFSALHLHDGAVTAEWLAGLKLRAAVVVLSACETGLAEQAQGDEQVGLVRGFLVAGAARVLATLWPVDDAVTARFMAAFYAAMSGGAGCASALQQAQTEVMRDHPHPCYWAGFALNGGW